MTGINVGILTEFFLASADVMGVIDAEGRLVALNPAWERLFGYSLDELRSKRLLELVHRDDRELAVAGTGALHNGPGSFEARCVRKDGSSVFLLWTAWRGRDDGLVYAVGREVLNVCDLEQLEEALRRSEQKLALHFQHTPLAVIEWNARGQVVAWNPAAERIFGYAQAEVLGRAAAELIFPGQSRAGDEDDEAWKALLARQGGTRSTSENLTKSGGLIVCEWYTTLLVDDEGRVMGVASLVDDVTDKKRTEEELRRRERLQAETIQRLSTPVIEVWQGVLALPVIGVVDSARASSMTESLLGAIVRTRAAFAIVDLTGMDGVDTGTADHLMQMVRTAAMLGSHCLVSGISPSIAQTITQLEIALGDITTFSTLRDALRFALKRSAATRRR